MSEVILSVLIPATPDRLSGMGELLRRVGFGFIELKDVDGIEDWIFKGVSTIYPKLELIIYCDDRRITIGEKREVLYKMATGKMSWQIDSDDLIAEDAIVKIFNALSSTILPDCITFREKCLMNGEYKASNHSLKYEKWQDNSDGYDYVRSPFYKDIIRTDVARSATMPHIRYNEDEQFSMSLRPLLRDELHIDEELYIYIYEPKDTREERYGLDN